MRYILQQARLKHLINKRNGYLALASGSIMVNALLSIFLFYMTDRERIVIIPPAVQKPFWVTSVSVSPEYLSEMMLYLTSLSFNITPSNVAMQHEILLRYVDAAYYATFKMKLLDIADKIKKEHITTTFYPSDIKVDTNQFIGQIAGDLQYTVGDAHLAPQHVIYQFKFSYQHGQLKIISFPEVNHHAS